MSAQGIRLSTSAKADTSHELVTRLDRLPVDNIENDIARGKVPNAYGFAAFGERVCVGSQEDAVIWSNGAFVGPAIGGVQMSIVSSSANDSAAGTGLRTIDLHYLDVNLIEHTEIVTLAGLTPVLTAATDIYFINEMHVITVGSNLKAAGNIIVSNGGITYAEILINKLLMTSSARMVPKGKRAFISGAVAGSSSSSADARVTIRLVSSSYNGNIFVNPFLLLPLGSVDLQDGSVTFSFPVPPSFGEGIVFGLTASVDKSCRVGGSIYGWMEDA